MPAVNFARSRTPYRSFYDCMSACVCAHVCQNTDELGLRISEYRYSCRLVNIVIANANIPRVSIEVEVGIFTGTNN